MDLAKARWRFQTVDNSFGTHVALVPDGTPDHAVLQAPARAIIGTGWDANRIFATLEALEEMYRALPEPPVPPIEDGVITMENT